MAAEVASLVASGGIEETLHPPPSTPQLDEESQRTGATPLGVTEPGMEEHGYLLHSQMVLPTIQFVVPYWNSGSNQKLDDGKAWE